MSAAAAFGYHSDDVPVSVTPVSFFALCHTPPGYISVFRRGAVSSQLLIRQSVRDILPYNLFSHPHVPNTSPTMISELYGQVQEVPQTETTPFYPR